MRDVRPLSARGDTVFIISRCAWTLFNFRLSLIRSIQNCGAKVIALGSGGDGYDVRLLQEGVNFREIPIARSAFSPLADCKLLLCLVRIFRQERPTIVHCFTIKPAIYATLAAWVARVPIRVVTITGLGYAFTSAGRWINKAVTHLYRVALSHAHIVFFQNRTDRDLFIRERIVSESIALLCGGSGVDPGRFSAATLPVLAGNRRPVFLMIARLIREKGVLDFVSAAAEVRRTFPDVEFLLLGGSDYRNPTSLTAAQIAAIQESSVVTLLGETDDVRPFIARADVAILPSYREGLPRSLLEAAAMGRPAIATDVSGCRDVVIDGVTGKLVPVMDPPALALAIIEYINDPDSIVTMGAAARRRVLSEFNEQGVISATLDQYDRLRRRIEQDSATRSSP